MLDGLVHLGGFVKLFFGFVAAESVDNFRLLRVDRRGYRRETCGMSSRMLDDVFAEGVMSLVAGRSRRLGRLKSHVIPTKVVLEIAADLAEALRPHGRTGSAFAG
jgi:hypothetical protein